MTITDQEKRNAWLSFATAAIGGFCSKSGMKVSPKVTELAEEIADDMLEVFCATFNDSYSTPNEVFEAAKEDRREEARNWNDRDDEDEPVRRPRTSRR